MLKISGHIDISQFASIAFFAVKIQRLEKGASDSQSKKVERSETEPRDLFYRQFTSQSGKNDAFGPICEP